MLETAMRALTGSDCHVVFKTICRDGPEPGLITGCYSPATSLERRKKSTRLPLNQGIAQAAMINKAICFTNDVLTDARFWPQEEKQKFSERYRTVVACPVITEGQVIGVLCFDWPEPEKYDRKYDQVLACFTDTISGVCYVCHGASQAQNEIAVNPK
jgi:putative methionine-R-sulfoxide reductase with GAF domain